MALEGGGGGGTWSYVVICMCTWSYVCVHGYMVICMCSIKVEINTSHAMCNMTVQQMMGKI